jgi:PAS domain S-box-containing protein
MSHLEKLKEELLQGEGLQELNELKIKDKKHIKERKGNEKSLTTINGAKRAFSSTAVRRIILILICSIIFSDFIIGTILTILQIKSLWFAEIIDSIVLVIVLFPVIYIYVRLPLVNNINEHKKEAEALQKSEEKYRTLIENMGEGVCIVNDEESFVFANPAAEKIFGVNKGELTGLCLSDFLPGEEIEIIKNESQKRRQGISSAFEHEIVLKDGSKKEILITATPQLDDNKFTGTFAILRDFTERRRAEAEIKLKNDELLKVNIEKDKFFSIIAHDLRGPLGNFLGLTEIMVERLPDMTPDKMQEIAVSMRNSADNLYRLLDNLLEWSRMQRGLIIFYPELFLLKPKISKNKVLALEATNKEIEISCDIPEDLMVFADKNMLGGIIRNLSSNAVKFTPKGGKITMAAKSIPGDTVEISIRDTGIGMDKEMIDNLFRLDINTSRKGTEDEPSTGLGLIICKDFIEKHGGKLRVDSKEGKGSVFSFRIPGNRH